MCGVNIISAFCEIDYRGHSNGTLHAHVDIHVSVQIHAYYEQAFTPLYVSLWCNGYGVGLRLKRL